MGNVYVVRGFSPNMIDKFPIKIILNKIDKDEFCEKLILYSQTGELKSAISQESFTQIVNTICGTQLERSRTRIKIDKGDKLLIVLTKIRVDDNKSLLSEEIAQMLRDGLIDFYEVIF